MDGKLILGKDLDNWNDSLATRAPYDLSESDKTGPQFMTGNDLARSAKISSDWKNPVAVYAQAYNPLSKSMQFAESLVTGTADSLLNLPANTSNIVAQMIVESTGKYQPIIDVVSILSDKNKREQLKKAAAESQDSLNETIDLLIDRDYPVNRFAQRVIANATSTVENRKIVRELYKQAHGVDSSKWYNEAASIIGAMVPAMAAGNIAFKGARLFGAGRNAAIDIAKSIAKGYIGAEMAGQYAEETAAQYLERTGDKNFENFTAKDASGLMATAYGAIGAQIEFMGGVEPIMAGALSKVGLRASALKAAAKIGAGEATEELLQGLTETLFRKIDGTSDKTWADGFKESLQGAAWGLFIGGTLGTTAFYANRQNLVKGIKTAMPSISDSEATLVADAMLDTAGEVSSQDPTLRNNLRQKIAMIYRDADIDNKEEAIDSLTDLEYSLITMDAVDRGIELKDHELFAGEVNELGWFRAGIPDERRADIQAINDNISDLKKQLAELNKAEEKDWEKIEEIENKLAQANQYVLEKMSDLARDDESAIRRMLRKVESKYVEKEQEKATKAAIKKGNIDIIRNILSDAGIRTRDLSGTQLKEMAKMNWKLLQGKDLGESDARLRTKVPLTVIEQNVESGNAVLLRAGYTQDQIEKMDDETWNRALLTQYRKEQAELGLENTGPEYTEEDIASWEGVEFQEQFDLADENARLDDIYPAYDGETINIDGKEHSVYNSNGDRIAKSEEALRNFYKWFGDSKVVDEQGRPLVVYHGTKDEFNEFQLKTGKRYDTGHLGTGFYFTNIEQSAKEYAQWKSGYGEERVLPLYLKIQNPLNLKDKDATFKSRAKKALGIKPKKNEGYATITETESDAITKAAKEQGYDGIIAPMFSSDGEIYYVAFEPTQIKSVDNRGTFSSDTGNIYYQPGYASMRGDLVGGALDADAFEGKGEGSSVWFWGNYLLADKNLDKEHYYNQFNRSRPNLTYDGKELNHFLLNSMGITFPETQNIITNRVGNLAITKDWLKKTLSTYLRNSESLYESRIKDVVKLVDFENLLSDEKYTEKEIRDVIKDIETILQGKGFTTGPLYKFPESTEEGKIQAKYFKDPKKKEFFETVYSKLFNVFGGESYLSSASSSFALELADLHSQRKSLKAIDNFDFDKLGGRTGLLFKGKDVEDLLDKIDMPFERWRVKDAIRPVIIDAIIKNKDVAKEINKIKEKPLFDEKKLKSDIDKLIAKKTKSESPAFVESIKSAFDMFLNSEDSGESAVRIMDKLGLTESEKEVVRDIVTDLKGEKYFVDKNNTWKPSISDVFFSVRAHKLFEQGLQRAKDLFKDAKNNDFLYKPNASMYSFDVPKDELFLSANTKLNKQTSFVKNALTDFIKDYVDTMPFLRDFISISGFNYDSARWLFDIDNKINGEFDEALLLDIANNMMTSYNLHGKTSAVENKLLDLMYRTIKGAATQTLGKKTTIQDVANEIDAAVITESPLVKSSNSKEYYEDIKTLGKILKDRLLKKFKPADLLEDVAPSLDVAGLSEKYTGKKMYDNIVGNIEIHPEIFNELKQDKSLGLTANAKSDEIVSKLLRKYGIAGGRYYGKRDKKGWVTFDRTPAIERLYQHRVSGAAPKTYRGAYIPLYRFILRANRMDASTLAHEIAHDWMEVNFKLYRSGKAGENFMRVWGALEKALGISEDAKSVPEQASEAFARAYEGWLLSNKDWTKFISVDDKDKEKIESLFKTYQNELRDIYNDISNPYFKNTWGKIGELKPELKAWFDRVVNITDLDVMVERGEMTEEEATKVKLNRAIDKVVQSTDDEETKQSLLTARTLNDTQRYEVEGGNKNSLQMRLSDLAKEIDENNFVLKGNKYNTHRDMLAVAEAADNFVKTRLEDALAIINGQMAEVEGLYKEDIYTALERLALENGDLDLIDELKDSEIANLLAKELGQRVAGFRNWKQSTDIDVVSAIQSLDNKFEDALKNKKAKEQFDSALDLLEKEIKNQDKTADKNVDSILKELECK